MWSSFSLISFFKVFFNPLIVCGCFSLAFYFVCNSSLYHVLYYYYYYYNIITLYHIFYINNYVQISVSVSCANASNLTEHITAPVVVGKCSSH